MASVCIAGIGKRALGYFKMTSYRKKMHKLEHANVKHNAEIHCTLHSIICGCLEIATVSNGLKI